MFFSCCNIPGEVAGICFSPHIHFRHKKSSAHLLCLFFCVCFYRIDFNPWQKKIWLWKFEGLTPKSWAKLLRKYLSIPIFDPRPQLPVLAYKQGMQFLWYFLKVTFFIHLLFGALKKKRWGWGGKSLLGTWGWVWASNFFFFPFLLFTPL